MLFAKRYLTFKTQDEAKHGLQILRQYAIEHSKYLSANAFYKIVYERDTDYDPCIGWTLSMLDEARIFTEPGDLGWIDEPMTCYREYGIYSSREKAIELRLPKNTSLLTRLEFMINVWSKHMITKEEVEAARVDIAAKLGIEEASTVRGLYCQACGWNRGKIMNSMGESICKYRKWPYSKTASYQWCKKFEHY